jgi:hypothetical protein
MDGPSPGHDGEVVMFGSQHGYLSDSAGGGAFAAEFDGSVGLDQPSADAFSSPLTFHQLAEDSNYGMNNSMVHHQGLKRDSHGSEMTDFHSTAGNNTKRRKKEASENWDAMYHRLVNYKQLHGVSAV